MYTNKDRILRVTAKDKEERIKKICSFLTRDYELQPYNDVTNIIVPAKRQEDRIVVFAHHDVYPGSKGYNDNSTGVVTLLKIESKIPDNVELVFTDLEEFGGIGCNLYLSEYAKPRLAINVDVVGLGDKIFYEEYGPKGVIKVEENMEYFEHIPFSDSHIIGDHGVPNILMLTGRNSGELIHDIFLAQHRGPKDGDLDLIQEGIMDAVATTLLKVIERNA